MERYVHTFSKRRGEVMFCSEILKNQMLLSYADLPSLLW